MRFQDLLPSLEELFAELILTPDCDKAGREELDNAKMLFVEDIAALL